MGLIWRQCCRWAQWAQRAFPFFIFSPISGDGHKTVSVNLRYSILVIKIPSSIFMSTLPIISLYSSFMLSTLYFSKPSQLPYLLSLSLSLLTFYFSFPFSSYSFSFFFFPFLFSSLLIFSLFPLFIFIFFLVFFFAMHLDLSRDLSSFSLL